MLDDEAEANLLVGKVVGERYKLEALLGVGGMGAVYRAQHVLMQKTLALKVLHRGMAQVDEVVARFEREAVAAGNIEHPNVARATDFGRLEDGAFFLVLEFIDGTSLRSLLARHGPMAPHRAVRIARQIAGAIGAAHALGIVHRDLKPENIMLVDRPDEPDFVKVLDFGIAKLTFGEAPGQRALTRVGAVFGTPEYMSPEQALGETVDARSDLYALGIIVYEMLEGSTPFASDEPTRVLAAHITSPPPPLPSHVPAPLAAIVARLLAKKPDQRISSAKELVLLLDEAVATLVPSQATSAAGATHPIGYAATQVPVSRTSAPSVRRPPSGAALPPSAAARAAWESLREELSAVLTRKLNVGGAVVPLWGPVAAAGGALLALVLFVAIVARACGGAAPDQAVAVGLRPLSSSSAATPKPMPATDDLRKEVERIEATPVYERKQKDWVALGHGYTSMGKYRDAALAFRGALSMGRQPAAEPQVLADMLECGKDSDAYPIIVNQCEAVNRRGGMGNAGLDLLWDLWLAVSQDPARQNLAEPTLKKLVISSRRGSAALRSAIELQAATGCKAMKSALAHAAKHADSRSIPRLQEIERTRNGCGADRSEDCFECIREGGELQEALTRALNHPAPTLANAYKE